MSRLNVDQIYTRTGTGSPAIREMPAFKYVLGATVSNFGSTADVAPIDTKVFNTHDSWYNTGTYRYTPEIPGYYWFRGFTVLQLTTSVTSQQVQLRKNGSIFARTINRFAVSSVFYMEACGLTYLNGSTDYVECWAQGVATTVNLFADGTEAASSSLEGFLVRPD